MQKPTFKNKAFTRKQAFTLIELLIVIAIIGILFIVLVSKVDFATDKAKATGVQTDFRSFQLAFNTVAKENAGFNTFGWDTGDANQDGIRNSYDEGDNGAGGGIAQNGIQDGTEVFTGHKVYSETFTKVYSLKKNGTGSYDRDALNRLETAINANLDPKLHITIKDDGEIVMANGAQDPWDKEYHGYYITNAGSDPTNDNKDRGAIVMYSDGPNNVWGSKHEIKNGIVTITNPGNSKDGKDDYSIVSLYTYINGYGEVQNITTGFSNNQTINGNNGMPNDVIENPSVPDIEEPEVVDAIAPGLYLYNNPGFAYKPTYTTMLYTWDELISMNVLNEDGSAVGSGSNSDPTTDVINTLTGTIVYPGNIKSIPSYALDKCINVHSVILQEGTTSIGEYAFYNLSSLDYISIPTTLQECNNSAFSSNGNVTRVDIQSFESWANINFANYGSNPLCRNGRLYMNDEIIKTFVFPESLSEVKNYVLHGGESITNVVLPEHYTSIGDFAFSLTSLANINIPSSIQNIGQHAFSYTNITSFDIPTGVTEINTSTFSSCTLLKSITIPNTVITIGDYAFSQTKLESIVIPNSVTNIKTGAFSYCKDLTTITIPGSVKTTGMIVFDHCSNLNTVIIEDGVEKLGSYMFDGCTSITNIVVPKSVIEVQQGCFSNCSSLETLIFYSETIKFQSAITTNCTSLKRVEIHATSVPEASNSIYLSNNDKEGVFVRSELVDLYKSNQQWSNIKAYIFALE